MLYRVRAANKFPDVKAHMQPSDFLASLSRGFGSPCQRPTSMQKLVLSRLHVLLRTRSALEMGHRHSVRPGYFEERRGPPRLLGHPLHTCRGATPRRNQPLLAHSSLEKIHGEAGIAFTQLRTLGNRNKRYFEATHPRPTCSRAYASPTSLPRPSQGSLPARAGSPLAGRDSHPRDSKQNFLESSQPSNSN